MLRVVFMGTPEFAVPALKALAPGHQLVGVYTQPDRPVGRGLELKASPVKQLALQLNIPVLQPEKLSLPGEFEKLQALAPDVIVVVAFGQILKKNILSLPRLGCVNIHSSLLPRWRGAAPIQRAIVEGDKESGVTTMHLVEKLDAGDILLQAKTPITSEDTTESLHDRLSQMGAELILETLAGLSAGTLKGTPQNETLVTYAKKLEKEEEWLDPSLPAETLDCRIRGLNPWPGTSLKISDPSLPGHFQRLKIKKAALSSLSSGGKFTPQFAIFEQNGGVFLGCAHGCLELLSLQWDGKKEVNAAGFINGLRGRGINLPLRCL